MYNRYIPQQDGSYHRQTTHDQIPPSQPKPSPPPLAPTPPQPIKRPQPQPAGGFLRNLLPREFDTADLIIVLLLLLMAGDSEEERSTALLTLALYFLL